MKMALCLSFIFLGQILNIDLAITPIEQSTGYMYRTEWKDDNQGMLFINKIPHATSFWMRNTHLNIILFYIDSNFSILERHQLIPLSERKVHSKTDNVHYVLEINPKLEKLITDNWKEFTLILAKELEKKKPEITELQKYML